MILSVTESEFLPPALVTDKATKVEFRDPEGYLVMFVALLHDGRTILVSNKKDADFEFNAKVHNIPLKINPSTVLGKDRPLLVI